MARGRTAAESWCAEAFAKLKGLIAGIVCLGRAWPRDIEIFLRWRRNFTLKLPAVLANKLFWFPARNR
ncbi:MAG: hypothetical protein DWI67_08880 [Chloroflexi bacterium]|nr:MAG: hypothetical protein DWI67_08880 [Chloroflexota bacterium]